MTVCSNCMCTLFNMQIFFLFRKLPPYFDDVYNTQNEEGQNIKKTSEMTFQKYSGGTTVSATMTIANWAGIEIFATAKPDIMVLTKKLSSTRSGSAT